MDRRETRPPDPVQDHYEKWPFPDIAFGGREDLIFLRYLREILNGGNRTRRVLDAGCGTGHSTIAVARRFPDAQFVGIDLSRASIAKAARAAAESNLNNVRFAHADLRDSNSLPGGSFDLIMVAGVLHHIEDAPSAFANLTRLLESDGVIILWLYGRYGRIRHSLNQAFVELLARSKSLYEREQIAAEFVNKCAERYAVDSGFFTPYGSGQAGVDWLLAHRQWLADQMIPPFEHCYTMREILELFDDNGLAFDRWLGVSTSPESHLSSELLLEEFRKLPPDEQLVAVDYLVKPEYYFVSGRKRNR